MEGGTDVLPDPETYQVDPAPPATAPLNLARSSVGAGLDGGAVEQVVVRRFPAGGDRFGAALCHRADQAGRGRLRGTDQQRLTAADHPQPGVLLELGAG